MRNYLLLICIFCSISLSQAQQFYMPQGSMFNIYPFGSNYGNRIQWLYHPSDFVVTPIPGNITKIYFKTWNGAPSYSATLANFSISMANTTLDTLEPTFVAPTTLVYSSNPLVIPATPQYTWFSFTLQTPFAYTGQNIVIEIQQNSLVAGGIYANITPVGIYSNARRAWGYYGSNLVHGRDNLLGDLGFDICPSCDSPVNIVTSNIGYHNANIKWDSVPCASGYEYLVDQNPGNPTGTGYPIASNPAVSLTGLHDSTCYYIHIRTHCVGAYDVSGWSVDSFCTLTDTSYTAVTEVAGNVISILAYPNPANEQVIVEIIGNVDNKAVLKLTDIRGKTLITQPVEDRKTTLKTGDLASGLYYIEYSDEQYKHVIKINKQ